ncbi:MAG: hypothetical protein GXP27_08885 [Planctomycetes bacterium]|nr:hypothetical protein [Planctomycetota bacterium]
MKQNLLCAFWKDEVGAILSAELVLLATLGVIGAVVGLKAVSQSVNDELLDVACAFRSLDQSYSYTGLRTRGAWVAGSKFQQEPVKISVKKLRQQAAKDRHRMEKQQSKWQREIEREVQRQRQLRRQQERPERRRQRPRRSSHEP